MITFTSSLGLALSMLGLGATGPTHKAVPRPDDEGMDYPHPFFTHMGMPDSVGSVSLRVIGTSTRGLDRTTGDLGLHLETGLADRLGLHVRSDGVVESSAAEIMFQYAAIYGRNKMSGFSPIIEFEVPTQSSKDRVNMLVGFTTANVDMRGAFNQVVHFGTRERMVEGSAAYVWNTHSSVYPIIEFLGEAKLHEKPMLNAVFGAKYVASKSMIVGFGVGVPLTANRAYQSRLIFPLDFEWRW